MFRLDKIWLARIAGERATPPAPVAARARDGDRRQDWGDAPGMRDFVGRTEELRTLRGWVLDERSPLVAILGMGGIGKTSLAARLAQDVGQTFERVYWRSLRDAPPAAEWLAGAPAA